MELEVKHRSLATCCVAECKQWQEAEGRLLCSSVALIPQLGGGERSGRAAGRGRGDKLIANHRTIKESKGANTAISNCNCY